MTRALSIGVTTKDRSASLRACIESLALLGHLDPEIPIFDDQSTVPAEQQLDGLTDRVRVLSDSVGRRLHRGSQSPR